MFFFRTTRIRGTIRLQFIIPAKHNPGTYKMSKEMLKDERVIDFIVKTVVGKLTPLLNKSNGTYYNVHIVLLIVMDHI